MYKYVRKLNYPINIKKKDLKMAKVLIEQMGGYAGELGAALRYFSQKFAMPDSKGQALLNDIAVEELGHVEMIGTMFRQLVKDSSIEEIKAAGLDAYFVAHRKGVYTVDASGNPFNALVFASTGDTLSDLSEDMAAEMKARTVYENLIDMTDDESLIGPLLFLRQREVVHFNRFKELYDYYKDIGIGK